MFFFHIPAGLSRCQLPRPPLLPAFSLQLGHLRALLDRNCPLNQPTISSWVMGRRDGTSGGCVGMRIGSLCQLSDFLVPEVCQNQHWQVIASPVPQLISAYQTPGPEQLTGQVLSSGDCEPQLDSPNSAAAAFPSQEFISCPSQAARSVRASSPIHQGWGFDPCQAQTRVNYCMHSKWNGKPMSLSLSLSLPFLSLSH